MRKLTGALGAILWTGAACAATLMPNGQQQFIDATGKPYANGRVWFYSNFPTCTVLKNTYQNEAGTVLNANPVQLDAAGRATIFGTGSYCQVLKDANNTTIWTKYTSDTSSASNLGWGGTGSGTANAQTVTVNGFTSLNGQTFYYVPSVTNTGPMTIAVNAAAPAAVVKETSAGPVFLSGGEVVVGTVTGMTYVAATGQFHLITNNNTLTGFVGEVRAFAYGSCPAGWLYADGTAKSATTYPDLFATIGTIWGTSAGNVVLPNFQNQFLRGDGSINLVGTFEANQNKSHTHTATSTVTDPGHAHTYTTLNAVGSLSGAIGAGNGTATTSTNTTGITVATTVAASPVPPAGTEARPDNYRVRFCIKY